MSGATHDPPTRTLARVISEHGGWRGALREFVIIVAGVLCALGAEPMLRPRR